MAAPSMTLNLTVLANQASIAASGSVNTGANAVDFRTVFEAQCQVWVTFGTVAATNGLRVQIYRAVDAPTSSTFDSEAFVDFTIPGTTSTSKKAPVTLGTGLYRFVLTNTDATNAITNVKILAATVSGIA
jgi:hypothetical protein